jgi:hypothetical protein
MGEIDTNRLTALERRLGSKLPADFIATLTLREPIREGNVALVRGDRIHDVRTTFRFDSSGGDDQIDAVYGRVYDAVPPNSLPFARDWAGNFYCLMLDGEYAGQVVFWDHERDADDHNVELLSQSIDEFYEGLIPDPRETGP